MAAHHSDTCRMAASAAYAILLQILLFPTEPLVRFGRAFMTVRLADPSLRHVALNRGSRSRACCMFSLR